VQVVGHFELLEKLGAGGMGEVFKARDQRLHRFVALKFLPETAGAQARERFQREARVIASLNHPHICTLYEIGQEGERPYLVLELLEGESLRARLARGAVPGGQLFEWGSQIADALDAAHRHGILHRDLKPDNIFVLPSGHVKVLDFGLARVQGETGPDDLTMTSPGVIMGTIPYMSPEQAKGEDLDARSDIFSFGSVFYEMAAGRRAFGARSAAEALAAVLHEQPIPPAQVRPELPAKVDEIAARCLEKDRELRYQSAADLRSELRRWSRNPSGAAEAGAASSTRSSAAVTDTALAVTAAVTATAVTGAATAVTSAVMVGNRWRWWRWAVPGLALAAVAAAGLGWWRYGRNQTAPAPHLQFRQLTFSGQVVDAVISPDGKFFVHIDLDPRGTSLHLFSVAGGSDVEIVPPSDGCCQSPTFSADGGAIYFLKKTQMYSVPVLGGTVHPIASGVCSGAGMSPDGSQIAYLAGPSGRELMLAKPDGSGAHRLQQAASGGYASQCWTSTVGAPSHSPTWSPDGHWIALAWVPASGSGRVTLVNAQTGEQRQLGPAVLAVTADVNWLPDESGLILTAALPQTAAPQVWEITYPGGQMRQLTQDLQGYTASSVATTGQLGLVHAVPQSSIWVQKASSGPFVQLPGGGTDLAGVQGVVWDGKGGLIDIRLPGGKPQIWAEKSDASRAHPVSSGALPLEAYGLLAAPDGQLVFGDGELASRIWRIHGDGTGLTQVVTLPASTSAYDPSLLLGGREVGYLLAPPNSDETLWMAPLDGGAPPRQVWNGLIYAGTNPASPDGTRVFAISRTAQQGGQAVIIRVDGKQPQITPVKGFDRATMGLPWAWTPDGNGIVYVHSAGSTDNLWVFPLGGGPPRALTHFEDLSINHYDFAHDGRLAISRGSNNADVVVATGLGQHKER
jgi:Tol biopolymer transport system component/tRNA A-37 threonylcarbamoyl transferase component Bud32